MTCLCFYFLYSILTVPRGGALLLVGGLYAVLWGKHVEGKSESDSEDTEDESKSKEETA